MTNFIPEQVPTLNNKTAVKRSHSPIKLCLVHDIDNDKWFPSEPEAKKKKRCNSSNSIRTNCTKKKSSKMTRPQGTIIRLYDVFISFIVIFLEQILKEYRNKQSIREVREQFERDERIKIQQEREEVARIERVRKQQLYNGALIDAYNQQQSIEFELVLETDPETDNIVIDVTFMLVIHMKSHQSKKLIYYLARMFL
jgi:hypothetical protein